MRIDRFLVLVKKDFVPTLKRQLDSQALPGWDNVFRIIALGEKRDVRKKNAISPIDVAYDLIHQWDGGEFKQILADIDVAFDRAILNDAQIPYKEGKAASIASQIFKELENRNLSWLSHAKSEWGKSEIQFCNPQAWQQQFAELGYPWVGVALLKQLKLISENDLRQAFQNHPGDTLGLKVCHAYFKDDEQGSSSISVKDVLGHLYGEKLIECDLDSEKPFGDFAGDRIYLYEDGLWSGVELVKRLEKLQKVLRNNYQDTQIHFRYGVSSDAGILSANYVLTKNKVAQVTVHTGRVGHINFIEESVRSKIRFGDYATYEEFRKNIDNIAAPYAFNNPELWLDKQEEAKILCSEIGKQLARPWVERTMRGVDIDGKSKKWSLGAFGFASTFAFSKSVPKPVLPLFWLPGKVTVGSQVINWKPLFWDVRSAGPVPLSQKTKW